MGKVARGSTPRYSITIYDVDGNIVSPGDGDYPTKLVVTVTNNASGTVVAKFSDESPTPEGYRALVAESTTKDFVFSSSETLNAPAGENIVEIKEYYTDTDYPDNTKVVVRSSKLNEFV